MKKILFIIMCLSIIFFVSCRSNYLGLKSGENENTFYMTDLQTSPFGNRWATYRATINGRKIIIEEIPR